MLPKPRNEEVRVTKMAERQPTKVKSAATVSTNCTRSRYSLYDSKSCEHRSLTRTPAMRPTDGYSWLSHGGVVQSRPTEYTDESGMTMNPHLSRLPSAGPDRDSDSVNSEGSVAATRTHRKRHYLDSTNEVLLGLGCCLKK